MNSIPKTAAGKIAMIEALMNMEILDEDGNPILDENGEPKTYSLISKEEALKLLGFAND